MRGSFRSGTTCTQAKAECLAAFPSVQAIIDQNADPSVQAASATNCMGVGRVSYNYQVAETELTVAQWATFLNTVDPNGHNKHHLWDAAQAPACGRSTGRSTATSVPREVSTTTSHRRNGPTSPYNVADFTRAARLANSLDNGQLIKRKTREVTVPGGRRLLRTTFTVRLSTNTSTGMYKMSNRKATRTSKKDSPFQPRRMDQGCILRSERRRQALVLGLPHQPRGLCELPS